MSYTHEEWTALYERDRARISVGEVLRTGQEDNWQFDYTLEIVDFKHNKELPPNLELLEKNGLKENKEMALHLSIYKSMKGHKISHELLKAMKKPFNRGKHEIIEDAKAKGLALEKDASATYWTAKKHGQHLQLMEAVKDVHMMVLNTFYKTPIFNVLDAHYLFTLLEQVDEYYGHTLKLIHNGILGKAEEEKLSMKEDHSPQSIRDFLERLREELKIWKNNKFMPDEEYIAKKKIIYRSRWQQHKKQQYQQRLAKKAGIKRQIALQRKADAIKGKDFGFNI
jgi:hypothetical protein